jgi:putative solute:sodium symporter small subunit
MVGSKCIVPTAACRANLGKAFDSPWPAGWGAIRVADDNQRVWWLRTARLAAIVLSGFAAVVSVPLLLADSLDLSTLFGLPVATFLSAVAAPCVLAMAVFWFADRQRALDHRHDVIED